MTANGREGFWRQNSEAARRFFEEESGLGEVKVAAQGNEFLALGLLYRLAVDVLRTRAFEDYDPNYPVDMDVRVVRGGP